MQKSPQHASPKSSVSSSAPTIIVFASVNGHAQARVEVGTWGKQQAEATRR